MQEKSEGKKNVGKSQQKNWFEGVRAEFRKIVWTDRETLAKQTVAVVVISVILAVIISIMDAGILEVINLFV